jgi:hypothetical protein
MNPPTQEYIEVYGKLPLKTCSIDLPFTVKNDCKEDYYKPSNFPDSTDVPITTIDFLEISNPNLRAS